VREQYRGKGYGKSLLKHICKLAIERDCGRVEWWCLDWNKPSIDFYLSLNAEPMTDWTVYRLNRAKLEVLALKT
jgi:GNAT superfamily N-acetyltransferase